MNNEFEEQFRDIQNKQAMIYDILEKTNNDYTLTNEEKYLIYENIKQILNELEYHIQNLK